MTTKIAISQFKAHCLEIIDKLQSNHESIIITKRDKPIARIIPLETIKSSIFGLLKNKADIKGDILGSSHENWDVEQND